LIISGSKPLTQAGSHAEASAKFAESGRSGGEVDEPIVEDAED